MKKFFTRLLCAGIVMSVVMSYGMCVFADVTDEAGAEEEQQTEEQNEEQQTEEQTEEQNEDQTEAQNSAEDTDEIPSADNPIVLEDIDFDNEVMAEKYVDRKMSFGKEPSYGSFAFADSLEGKDRVIFEYLVPAIGEIADGERTSTIISIPSDILSIEFTAEELGLEELDRTSWDLYAAVYKNMPINPRNIVTVLLYACPYECYWFDKTQGYYPDFKYDVVGDKVVVEYYRLYFSVVDEYQKGNDNFTVDPAFGQGLKKAGENAKAIVAECAGLDDYHKLLEYNIRMCLLTDYNFEIYEGETISYGDPWQIVWLFDGDPSTKVVCEGYAKGFNYLCDNTAFADDSIYSIMVSGSCEGAHMWNFVHMDDGKNYIVDVTNSDPQGEGNFGTGYFLRGGTGSVSEGYTIRGHLFEIGSDMPALYGEEALTLSETDYVYENPEGKNEVILGGVYNGSATLSHKYADEGEEVTVTATPNEGYELNAITVNGQAITGNTFAMPKGAAVVRVVFLKIQYTIELADVENGTVTFSADTAGIGDEVTITAVPDDWYKLDYIKVNGEEITGNKFNMPNGNVTVEVSFVPAEHKITLAESANGIFEVNTLYANTGDLITVTCTQDKYYELDCIKVNGNVIEGMSFEMPDEDVTVEVTFKKILHSITVMNFDHGTATLSTDKAGYGDEVEIFITMDEWYKVRGILINDVETTDTKFIMPDKDVVIYIGLIGVDCEVELVYDHSQATCQMVYMPGFTSTDKITVPYGTNLGIDVIQNKGYKLFDWKVDGQMHLIETRNVSETYDISVIVKKSKVVVEFEFKPNSEMTDGWHLFGNDYYYLKYGVCYLGFQYIRGKHYYFDPASGKMMTGWVKRDGEWYYFKESGEAADGWLKIGKYWYYFETGWMEKDIWISSGGRDYYIRPDGTLQTGWINRDYVWMYYDEDGQIVTGWQKISGKWYYFDEEESYDVDGDALFIRPVGSMRTGWKKISGKWYYFEDSGAMVTGWKKVSGKWYFFENSGSMVTGWKEISGKWYYFTKDGDMKTGWFKDGGKWYFLRSSGEMATGWAKTGGKWYYFDKSGVMQTGWVKSDGNWYYLSTATGIMVSSITAKIGNREYTFDSNGVCTNP
ncbi:InlB B-repeat-containing protein [Butyrivibrio sp. AE2032]|uniref:InlB B-repeat-containing protein n=1 Tax=Butyrivibrio sp. AE2032 TaxID=1458463 RepID=UPI0006916AE7|nr:N-acetylmuramoyl-L-alanine amidase family protein [Butyrivibrio sp. AE2032]